MNSLSGRFLRLIGRRAPQPSVLRTSDEWLAERPGTTVLDPDGWDRRNWEYSFYRERITYKDFIKRLSESTIRVKM